VESLPADVVVDSLNNSLQVLGETPIKKKRLNEKYYPKNKVEKVTSAIKRSEKMTVLSVLPKSWTIDRMQKEFSCSNYMARKVKELVKEKGILSSPNPKPGKVLGKQFLLL
jgi:hypothetical protein